MSLANLLREAKGGACPPLLRSYVSSPKSGEVIREQKMIASPRGLKWFLLRGKITEKDNVKFIP
ncbi:hypothetical protein AUK22_00400 [bacterium CG2_30_54_10]|nr:MAG: hypothetical protein AUK22_00400 [bacterium CG2_30_54_10]